MAKPILSNITIAIFIIVTAFTAVYGYKFFKAVQDLTNPPVCEQR